MKSTSVSGRFRQLGGYRRQRSKPIRAGAEDRLKRINKKRLRRERNEILRDIWLGGAGGLPRDKSKAQYFSNQGGGGGDGQGPQGFGEDITIPSLETPSPAAAISKPTISTVIKQLNVIVTVSQQIANALRSQQEALIQKATTARQAAKENAMESRDAEKMQFGAGGDDLQPVQAAVDQLSDAISDLSDKIQEQSGGYGNGALDLLGMGAGKGKWGKILKGALAVAGIGAAGAGIYSAAGGSLSDLVPSFTNNKSSNNKAPLPQPPNTNTNITPGSPADNVTLSSPTPIASSQEKVASVLQPGLQSANQRMQAEKSMSDADVQKLATPLINQTINSNILKTIPIAGPSANISSALDKIIQGNPAGAGVDPASGLITPLSGIPALSTTITNDLYSKIYGVDPDTDPQASKRMSQLRKQVDSAIAERIKPLIKAQSTTSGKTKSDDNKKPVENGKPSITPNMSQSGGNERDTRANNPNDTSSGDSSSGGGNQGQDATNVTNSESSSSGASSAAADSSSSSSSSSSDTTGDATKTTKDTGGTKASASAMPAFMNAMSATDARNAINFSQMTPAQQQAQIASNNAAADVVPESVVTARWTMKKHPFDKLVHDLFAWDKQYRTPEENAYRKQRALELADMRRKNFGRENVRQILADAVTMLTQTSSIGLNNNEALLPSMKPAAAQAGLVGGVGNVPSPDYLLFAKYSENFYFGMKS